MKTSLLKGETRQRQTEIKQSYEAGKLFVDKLREVIKDKIEHSNKTSRSELNYESPVWAYKQADYRGYERGLEEIISLLE